MGIRDLASSSDSYSDAILLDGHRTGHPNLALDTACTLYLAQRRPTSQPNPSRTYAALH